MDRLWTYLDNALPTIIGYAGKAIAALVVLIIGWWVINLIMRGLNRMMHARHVEATLSGFINNVLTLLLRVMLLISVASMVGVATTSFITIIGAMGLAVSMAWRNSLSNFAGGVMILLFRPFKVGDYITCGSNAGTVVSIEIFRTVLRSISNDIVYVPNAQLSDTALVNNSENGRRMATVSLQIDYDDDLDKARELLLNMVKEDDVIIHEPAPSVVFTPQKVNIDVGFYFWVPVANKVGKQGQYGEEAIKVLKQNGFQLGTTTRAVSPSAAIPGTSDR